jgi:hypothetical protein
MKNDGSVSASNGVERVESQKKRVALKANFLKF